MMKVQTESSALRNAQKLQKPANYNYLAELAKPKNSEIVLIIRAPHKNDTRNTVVAVQ